MTRNLLIVLCGLGIGSLLAVLPHSKAGPGLKALPPTGFKATSQPQIRVLPPSGGPEAVQPPFEASLSLPGGSLALLSGVEEEEADPQLEGKKPAPVPPAKAPGAACADGSCKAATTAESEEGGRRGFLKRIFHRRGEGGRRLRGCRGCG